jgi:NADPH:quinone reductase
VRAVVLDAVPAPPDALVIRELPVPRPEPGWVLIEVKAFGLNRSELKTRLGLADADVTLPRVLGIEATGVVAACPGGELAVGQQVAAMMGGMGRSFDGGYAEFTCVPVAQAIPFRSELPWTTLGAVPEMLQTAYGALTVGLDVQPGQTLLIRGGTSSVGLTAAILARRRGLTVLAATRSEGKAGALRTAGADHVVVDDGAIIGTPTLHDTPGGVDATLELIRGCGRRRRGDRADRQDLHDGRDRDRPRRHGARPLRGQARGLDRAQLGAAGARDRPPARRSRIRPWRISPRRVR